MSQNPSAPPEISSREDTPADSLLARLRKITGLAEPLPPTETEEPAPMSEEERETGPPPVDQLIAWLQTGLRVLKACVIILGVMLAIAALWLVTAGISAFKRSRAWVLEKMRIRRERVALREKEASVAAAAPAAPKATLREEPVTIAAPVAPPLHEKRTSERTEPEVVKVRGVAEMETKPVPIKKVERTAAAGTPRRRLRKVLLTSAVVIAAAPALLLVPAVRYSLTSYLGWGNAAVIAGSEGWLFPRPVSSPALPALRDTVTALRAGGGSVVVISVPSKAAVYPEKLDPKVDGNLQRNPNIMAALKELAEAGAQVLDLGPVLHGLKATDSADDSVFRVQGSRWSPRAVEKSAAAAAAFLQQQPGYAALPLRPVTVELAKASVTAPVDDLAAAFPSRRWHEAHAPQALHFIRLLTAEKKPITSDAGAPVLLIGGNEARLYDLPILTNAPESVPPGEGLSAGFGQYLSMYLSTSLELHTGDNSVAAAKEWLAAKPEVERKGKRFVVWLIADDDLLR